MSINVVFCFSRARAGACLRGVLRSTAGRAFFFVHNQTPLPWRRAYGAPSQAAPLLYKIYFLGVHKTMEITKKDVELSGKLAKMQVSGQEADIYKEQLEALFKWVAELQAVNTDGVELTQTALAAHLRQDNPVEDSALSRTLISAFNEEKDDCAKVKKVL